MPIIDNRPHSPMGAVITNEETQEKIAIKDPSLFPVFAIVDPELMKTVPPKFTAENIKIFKEIFK
jgi:alcohol dehydrogenase class IV